MLTEMAEKDTVPDGRGGYGMLFTETPDAVTIMWNFRLVSQPLRTRTARIPETF